jgi:hypothetical protein
MKKALAILALLIATGLIMLGLLFLIAAAANPQRVWTGLVFLALSLLPLIWGITTLRRQAEISPEALSSGPVALARRLGGEVTVTQVEAEFRISPERAQEVLDKLRAAGLAQAEQRDSGTIYVLRGLQPAVVTRRCPYCGSTFPVKEAIRKCPNCGASLEVDKQ